MNNLRRSTRGFGSELGRFRDGRSELNYAVYHDRYQRTQPDPSSYAAEYGRHGSLADLLRQIGHDERTHKLDSLANTRAPRFDDIEPGA